MCVCVHVYLYMHIFIHAYTYIHVYNYIKKEESQAACNPKDICPVIHTLLWVCGV